MSKKNYVRIAAILEAGFEFSQDQHARDTAAYIAEELAHYFIADNPRFNRETFLRAAGHPAYQKGALVP